MIRSPAQDGKHSGTAGLSPRAGAVWFHLSFTDLPDWSAPERRPHNESGKRAETLARNPRGILKRSSTPTPSLLQPQLSSAQATKPSVPGEPPAPFLPAGTTQPGQESIPFGGVRRKRARPCQAGGEEGFHSHCSHSDRPTMGEGAGGRRCLRSLSDLLEQQQPGHSNLPTGVFSPLPPLEFPTASLLLPLPAPTLYFTFNRQEPQGRGPSPGACHLLPAPACL